MKRIQLADLAEMIEAGRMPQLAEHCYCCDKVRYPTREAAAKVGAQMAAKGKGHAYPYECHRRGGWHLTAKKPNDKAARTSAAGIRWRRLGDHKGFVVGGCTDLAP